MGTEFRSPRRVSSGIVSRGKAVFDAWTQPEHFARWLGPKGLTTIACQMHVQVGGIYRACIRSPEGKDHWMQGVYREVMDPERLVFTFAWEDEDSRPKHATLVTVTFIGTR